MAKAQGVSKDAVNGLWQLHSEFPVRVRNSA